MERPLIIFICTISICLLYYFSEELFLIIPFIPEPQTHVIWGRSAVLRKTLEALPQCQNKLPQPVFTQSNAQVQRWRGKGLLMFPGLFILLSVWLRTPTHPSLRTSFSGSHLKWHAKACDMIGEEHNVACVRGREKTVTSINVISRAC